MSVKLVMLFSVFLTATCHSLAQRSPDALTFVAPDDLERRRELSVPLGVAAKLKIGLRKRVYSRGEMMIVDVAMMIRSEQEYYFSPMDFVRIDVENNAGKTVSVNPFLIVDRRFIPFRGKEEMHVHSVNLIIGCGRKDLSFPSDIDKVDDDPTIFDRGLFISTGDGCIDIRNVGKYAISATLSNEMVVLSTGANSVKTAVGTLTSNKLEIDVVQR